MYWKDANTILGNHTFIEIKTYSIKLADKPTSQSSVEISCLYFTVLGPVLRTNKPRKGESSDQND